MKKSELRVWVMRMHLPDEWWVETDGTVTEDTVNLDTAFRLGDEAEEAFIIHASHAEETEEPHWIPMGAHDQPEDQFEVQKWVCAKCSYAFDKSIRKPKPASKVEIAGYALVVPGIVMTTMRKKSAARTCPRCGSSRLVRGSSRSGKALLAH